MGAQRAAWQHAFACEAAALHKEHALMCIAAGKHVPVEKPICFSAADAKEMYDAAAAKGVMLQEGMWTRYFPAVEHARALIDGGAIGEVRLVQADLGGFMLGGGPSDDMLSKRGVHNSMLGCYIVQAASLAFGADAAPTKIAAAGSTAAGGYNICTSVGATVEFDTDHRSICALTWSMEAPMRKRVVIAGSHGRITIEGGAGPTELRVVVNPKPDFYPGAYHGLYVPIDETVTTYPLADPSGLRPGVTYFYSVGDLWNGFSPVKSFRCSDATERGEVRWLHYGDMGTLGSA